MPFKIVRNPGHRNLNRIKIFATHADAQTYLNDLTDPIHDEPEGARVMQLRFDDPDDPNHTYFEGNEQEGEAWANSLVIIEVLGDLEEPEVKEKRRRRHNSDDDEPHPKVPHSMATSYHGFTAPPTK